MSFFSCDFLALTNCVCFQLEILVIKLNSWLKFLDSNIVSVGELTQTIDSISNLYDSGILPNAAPFIVLHNHSSGELTLSKENIAMAKRVIGAC